MSQYSTFLSFSAILTSSFLLGCGSAKPTGTSNLVAASATCETLGFKPTSLSLDQTEPSQFSLDIDLQTRELNVSSFTKGNCDYSLSTQELSEINSALASVQYCAQAQGASNTFTLFGSGARMFSMAKPSKDRVKLPGGWEALHSQLNDLATTACSN